jgi:hypothetical protein
LHETLAFRGSVPCAPLAARERNAAVDGTGARRVGRGGDESVRGAVLRDRDGGSRRDKRCCGRRRLDPLRARPEAMTAAGKVEPRGYGVEPAGEHVIASGPSSMSDGAEPCAAQSGVDVGGAAECPAALGVHDAPVAFEEGELVAEALVVGAQRLAKLAAGERPVGTT